jgi:hypothetical protein
MGPSWSDSTRGLGLACSGCCNPYQRKKLRGGVKSGEDGNSLMVYTYEGNSEAGRQGCIMFSIPPFIIFAPIFAWTIVCDMSASRLTISLSAAADGSTQVVGELRTKTCCGEEEEKLTGIRGAEIDKTLWTTAPNARGGGGAARIITCHLELLLPFGTKTIDCDQAGGERAAREINEFIHQFAPHVMAPPSQQMMMVAVPQAVPMAMQMASPPQVTKGSAPPSYSQPVYAQQRV